MIPLADLLTIIALQVTYVSMLSVRLILMVKGFRYLAASMSAVEIGIYVIGFKLVLDHLEQPLHLAAYCISYGVGVLFGIKLEERLALGYVTVQIITKDDSGGLADMLRRKGYGVTRWEGEGREGSRWVHIVVVHRKKQQQLCQEVLAIDPNAFIISYEPKIFHGGFLTRRV